MITLNNISLQRGTQVLFENANWTIFHKQRIGIIGANGAGKSSLFAILLGELEPDQGEKLLPTSIKLAHVAQETPSLDLPAIEFVLDGDTELRRLQYELQQVETENNGKEIARIHGRLDEIDAYTAPSRAAQLLNGLGFQANEYEKPVKNFSGGWRVRLNLAKALMCRSDVLLLDEPTNHLDLDAIIWLENWLTKYPGTLLVISHDREFLDKTVNHVLHIYQQQFRLYSGNYSAFETQRVEQLRLQQATYEKQQKEIAHLHSFINRFRAKATKARQAQSRMKALERMDIITAAHVDSPFHFSFKPTSKCSNPLIQLENISLEYNAHPLFSALNFSIAPNDRIALLGPNGAGKTSFLRLLAGVIAPTSGKRFAADGLKIGYLAQHQIDTLNMSRTPLDHLKKLAPDSRETELRGFLGQFGFSGNRALDTVQQFSGGEKSRLALALLIWQQPNLLLLDEPTNHLDLDMREALTIALQSYEGAMILVSHDRFLVKATADQLLLVANGAIQPFAGDLTDYQAWLTQFRRDQSPSSSNTEPELSRREQRQQAAKKREHARPLVQKIKKLEDLLDQLQSQINAIEQELTDNDLYQDVNKAKLQALLIHQAELNKKIRHTEEEWLTASEQLALLNS